MITWRKEITALMRVYEETWGDIVSCTLTDLELDEKFDDGYGGSEGAPFTVWTHGRVYFPAVYDGSEWVASVSRNPDGIATSHVGGE